ncbi:hypothetical protein D3C73_986720 [compost metagenome]
MIANSAATAAGARAYDSGSHRYSGISAALAQNTNSNRPIVAFTRVSCAGGTSAMRCDSSAMFNDPSEAYSRPSAIRNKVEAVTLNTT